MIYNFGERRLKTSGRYFIAPSADVIGSVSLGDEASIWFGAVLRGDNAWIHVGDGSNVQDGSIIHVDPDVPVVIGNNVTIGHGVMLHGCVIEDGVLVGNRAIVLDGARIGTGSLIAAGTLIPPNMKVPPGSVVMGSPGKVVRQVQPRDVALIAHAGEAYRDTMRNYAALLSQSDIAASNNTIA
jgi:carbonic anhydrase/acetyltransferase-like protein (isoleucine patch superfamily)